MRIIHSLNELEACGSAVGLAGAYNLTRHNPRVTIQCALRYLSILKHGLENDAHYPIFTVLYIHCPSKEIVATNEKGHTRKEADAVYCHTIY